MKQTLRRMAVAVAVLTLALLNVRAYDFQSGTLYYNIISADDLTCSVTSGDAAYTGDITIPATAEYGDKTYSVTQIGNSAFAGCRELTSITLGPSVTTIGEMAFYNCRGLTTLN